MSIRTKALLILAAFIVLPGILFGSLIYSNARTTMTQSRIGHLETIASLKRGRIEAFFREWKADIRSVQQNPDILQYLPGIIAGRENRGSALYRISRGELAEQLRAIQRNYGYLNIYVTDVRGRIVYANDPTRQAIGPTLRPAAEFFATDQRGIYFTTVYRRQAGGGGYAMIGAAPLFDLHGARAGSLIIELDMRTIYELVTDRTGLGDTGEIVISRREGDSVLFLSPLRHDPDAALVKRAGLNEKNAYPSQRAALGETGSGIALDYAGQEVLAAWDYIPEVRWGIVTKISAKEAFAPVLKLRSVFIALGVAMLLFGVYVAVATARSVTRPVLALQQGMEAIGRGNLDHKVGTDAPDEVGQLSRMIDNVTANLKRITASRDELNAQIAVRERTERILVEQSRVLEAYFKHAQSPLVFLDREFNFLRVNEAYARVCGRDVEDFRGHNHFTDYPSDDLRQKFEGVVATGLSYQAHARPFEFPDHPEWGISYWDLTVNPIRDDRGNVDVLVFSLDDVTDQWEAERRKEATSDILALFTRKAARKEYLDAVVERVQAWCRCRHAGIRIRGRNGSIPFESHTGYDDAFMGQENCVSLEHDDCICTRVIKGTPADSDRAFVTANGSYVSNDTRGFLGSLDSDASRRYRGTCMRTGYSSLAVIPIRYRDEAIGALHVADERQGKLPQRNVEFLEQIAAIIGEAVYRFDIEDELRRNYDALQVSEARYRSLVENIRDIIFTITPEGMVVSLNRAFEDVLGLRREDLLGSHFSRLLHPGDLERTRDLFGRAFAGETVPLFALRARTASGEYRDFELKIAPGLTGEGMVLGTARDVTERKRAEEQLNLFASLINQSLDAVFVADPATGAFMVFNDAACQNTGYSREELSAMRVTDLSRKHIDEERWRGHVAGVRERGSLLIEDTICRKDGSEYPVEVSVRHIVHQDRGYLLAFIRNISERKQAEEERARLASAVEAAADAIVITDPGSGVIQYANPAYEQMTGYALQEIVGRTLHFLESGTVDEAVFAGIRTALETSGVWSGRLTNRKKDGMLYFEDCTVSPVRNRNGEIINYVYVKRDVTEKMRLESIAEAVNAMDNIGSVFSGVRHEIGNPVNAINMLLGVLREKIETLPPESVRAYLGRMAEQVSRIEYILRSLKSFNLYESQEPQDLPLAPFLENFLPLVRQDLSAKGITLETSVAPGIAAWADPRALQQVLLNIITNAADALEDRKDPAISLLVDRMSDRVRIRVRDNGHGVPPERMKDIFRPFFTTKKHGTGLGLVIVRKMLTRMQGTVELASAGGEGTTVEILIPEVSS